MSTTSFRKLEDEQLWRTVSAIAEEAYHLLDHLPEEEKWGMQSKLRQRAFEITSEVAEAFGSVDPRDAKWHFGLARRDLFGLKNLYKLAQNTGNLEVDPATMHKLDHAIDQTEQALIKASENIPAWYEEMDGAQRKKT